MNYSDQVNGVVKRSQKFNEELISNGPVRDFWLSAICHPKQTMRSEFTDIALETPTEKNENATKNGESVKIIIVFVIISRIRNGTSRIRNGMIKWLEDIYYTIGLTIARFPIITIIISITIPALLSIGMLKFELDEDFADLLLPPTSRIFPERDWVEEHVPYEQRPVRLILKNDNVLSKESLIALYDFHMQIRKLTDSRSKSFDDVCVRIGPQCFVDSLLALWKNDIEKINSTTDQEIINDINTITKNPTYYFDFNATRMLSLIERNESGHIVKAGIMHADWFMQSSIELKPYIKELEYKAIDLALAGHPAFEMINVFTMDSYQEEFFSGVYGDIILIVYGFPVVLLYIILALGRTNILEHGVYMTIAAILGVLLSAGACYGIGLASGLLFGAPHQALIFLLLAVGVDNAFVIITTWNRVQAANTAISIEERIALTMQHAGVSISVTSFSDLVAFACGISTQMPVLQSFCVYCSIGIFLTFLMQSTLFPACLTLNQRRIENNRDACFPVVQHEDYKKGGCYNFSQRNFVQTFLRDYFAPALLSIPGKIIVLLVTFGLAGVMFWGITNIRKGFEVERSLPTDSYVRNFLESQRLYFSDEGPGIQCFCGPLDYQKNIVLLDEMANRYVNSSVVMYGLVANWISMYKFYIDFKIAFGANITLNSDGYPNNTEEFYDLLDEFLQSTFGLPFSKYIELSESKPKNIKWTYFPFQQIVSQDVWENEHIMEEVRKIADETTAKLDGGTCFVYSIFHIFTEVIRYVDWEITRNFILAGIAIFVVTLLLIVDVITSFFVLICVVLTTIDIMGSLHFWDFYMDVNMVVLLIISIGLAVDFSAHIGYTFMTVSGSRYDRAKSTIYQIGPAIFHGAVTTFLVFFVLIFGRSLSLFFAVFILVVIFGLFHGLCFLPVVLSIIGPSPYYNAGPSGTDDTIWHKDRMLRKNKSKDSNSNVPTPSYSVQSDKPKQNYPVTSSSAEPGHAAYLQCPQSGTVSSPQVQYTPETGATIVDKQKDTVEEADAHTNTSFVDDERHGDTKTDNNKQELKLSDEKTPLGSHTHTQ